MRLRPFAVERWFNQYEFKVAHNIAESCVRPLDLRELLSLPSDGGDGADLGAVRLGYVESDGRPELRALVAALYPGATPDDVLITVGAIEANYLALSALCGPDDRVIVTVPTYQQLHEVPRAQGARVDFWQLRPENNWQPDLDDLRRLLREPASLVVVNFPNNPTGVAVDGEFLAALVGLCRARGARLYADEVYRGLPLDREEGQPSAWSVAPQECVVVGSLSKAYGLPGLRVGWLVAPPEVRARAHEIRDYTSLCSPALSEEIAVRALRSRAALLARQRAHARHNLSLVEEFLATVPDHLAWVRPQEGVVGFVRYAEDLPSRELARRLAEEWSTLVVPGDCFGVEGHFRLGFGYDTAKLVAGLERLGRFVRSSAGSGSR